VTQRAEARTAGFAYLSYIVFTMSSTMIYGKATAGDGVMQRLSSLSQMISQVRVTVLLDLLQVVCALVLAVTLYRLTKVVDPTLAMLAMMFRVGEGLIGSSSIVSKLEVMRLATGSTMDAASARFFGNYIFNRPDELFSEFCFVVGGFVFAYLFLRGRLIPTLLAWIGVVAIGIQMVCVPLHTAAFIGRATVDMLWLVILAYEIPLGFWLIIKGVKNSDAQEQTQKSL
jgi:uncharacterized protein DUF4386